MQIVAIVITTALASLVFSMVGGGGTQILVPLFFWIGLKFDHGAIPLALLVASINCFSAGAIYIRRKVMLSYKVVVPLAATVLVGAPLGAITAHFISSRVGSGTSVLMIAFALSNMAVGGGVLRSGKKDEKEMVNAVRLYAVGVTICFGVGFFIGLVGRDGAPFVLALLIFLGLDAKKSAGAAAVIIAAGCLAAFITHLSKATLTWEQVIAAAVPALIASQMGARFMTDRMGARTIQILFALLMFVVGAVILIQAVAAI